MQKSLLLIIVFLIISLPTLAQENPEWSAYLFYDVNNSLIRVNSAGEEAIFSLGIENRYGLYSMKISADGEQVAYCASQPNSSNDERINQLVVRDIEAENNLFVRDLGDFTACTIKAFQGELIGFSLYYGERQFWEFELIDFLTGETITSLNSAEPAMQSFQAIGTVYELSRETMSFMIVPHNPNNDFGLFSALEWNFSTSTFSELPTAFGYTKTDYLLETGELVFAALDESITAMPSGSDYEANVVKVLDSQGERTIYQTSDYVITDVDFVNNGWSILISLSPGENVHQLDGLIPRYLMLNRDGSSVEFQEELGAGFGDVDSFSNGAIYVFTLKPRENEYSPTAISLLNPDGSVSGLAEVLLDYSLGWSPPQLVWTSPSTVASDLAPFVGQ